jgi:alkylated DNA repair protein (DNA oxidative demethylase)
MSPNQGGAIDDLFAERNEVLADGAVLLRGFARDDAHDLLAALHDIVSVAPFRHMITPGGYRMSVAMTNCGTAGWVSDKQGYRYDAIDPETEQPWPSMPSLFRNLAVRAADEGGYSDFEPDACLINRYEPGARLTLHQDKNERDFRAPIVSVSLGLPATFQFGGLRRSERPQRYKLLSGDVAVWGGASRRCFHGVAPLAKGCDPVTGESRFNLTFRKAL